MRVKIAGTLNDSQQLAVARAKAYHGKQPYQEFFADCVIWYKNDWAAIIPMQHSAYSLLAMPNPIPFRGVWVGAWPGVAPAAESDPPRSFIMASDGEILAAENVTYGTPITYQASTGRWFFSGVDVGGSPYPTNMLGPLAASMGSWFASGGVNAIVTPVWTGSENVWMFTAGYDAGQSLEVRFDHNMAVVVPDDNIASNARPATQTYPGDDGLDTQWDEAIVAAQAAFDQRIETYKKANSDTVVAQLAAGTMPTYWEYVIKHNAPRSFRTYRDPTLTVSSSDAVVGGVTTRAVAMSYTLAGELREYSFTGSKTVTSTQHTDANGVNTEVSTRTEYVDWYDTTILPETRPTQFLRDGGAVSLGVVWNGAIQTGHTSGSAFTAAQDPTARVAYVPAWPVAADTLVGTAPQFVLDWRAAVIPKYIASGPGASVLWNDSALMGGQTIKITMFGPPGRGMFGTWDAADTTVEVYGAATFTYSYATGAFVFASFALPVDSDGDEVEFITLPLDGASLPTTNTVVQYGGLHWADAIVTADAANALIRPPADGEADTRTPNQKLQYAIQTAI